MTIRSFIAASAALFLLAGPASAATLLVGNTDGNDIVLIDTVAGTLSSFIAAGSGGLTSPDDITLGPDGNIYVSSGTATSGAILRYDRAGNFLGVFATAPSLKRPYGHAFGPDGYLYVASFRSDEILRFDGATGAFVDVFASGDGTADGLNGPNDLHFGPDGKLYVTTQGSVADGLGGIDFSQKSQILRYDIATGLGEVFADQPPPDPASFGFVSFLGLATGPDGRLWTTDFANGLRVYDYADGSAFDFFATNYTGTNPSNNFIGALAFAGDALFVVGFDFTNGNLGSLLTFAAGDPAAGFAISFAGDPGLRRPIGILPVSVVPLPAGGLLLLTALGALALGRRRRESGTRARA
jgi:sugar lactone lactonase YvrE